MSVIEIVVGAGVTILVLFEILKWVKAHPSNPIVQQAEAKIPANVLAAAGIPPAMTGDHAVALVAATGNAVATAVQAVAQATAPKPDFGPLPPIVPAPNVTDLLYRPNAEIAAVLDARVAAAAAAPAGPSDNPSTRPPYPSYRQVDVTNGGTDTCTFTLEAGSYAVGVTDGMANAQGTGGLTLPDSSVIVVPWEGVKDFPAGSYTSTMSAIPGNPNSTGTRLGMQLYKR